MTPDPAVTQRSPLALFLPLALLPLMTVLPACGGGDDPGGEGGSASGTDTRVEYWDTAKTLKRSETQTLWGKLHGDHKEWFQEGQLKVSGRYEDGRKVGIWEERSRGNALLNRKQFEADLQHGIEESWYKDGANKGRGDWTRGVRSGTWQSFHEGGIAVSERIVFEGGQVLSLDTWYPTGEEYSKIRTDLATGEATLVEVWPSGELRREASLLNGELQGLDTRYHEIGERMSEENWEQGKKVGVLRTWHPTGDLRSEGELVDGVAGGVWHEWHLNGELQKEGRFERGVQVGEWRIWYDDGSLERLLLYEAGAPTGLIQSWHRSGKRMEFGNLSAGRQQGAWFYWSEEGELDLERSGQYSGTKRVGDLTEEELGKAVGLAEDPTPMLPDLPDEGDGPTPEDG